MTNNTLKKVLAGSAMAAMLLPMAASAHGIGLNLGGGLNFGAGGDKEKTQVEGNGTVNIHANGTIGNKEKDNDNDQGKKDGKGEVRGDKGSHATTTAARIQTRADIVTAVGAALSAKSASSSDPVAFAAALSALNSAAASAKTQATVDIGAARNFLHDAVVNLKVMFRLLWN